MKIFDIPEENRPRERLLKRGVEALSDSELLAIILRTGTKGESVIDMSNRLISEYGLENLYQCTLKEIQKIKGMGEAKAMQILAISELNKRQSLAKKAIRKITCAKDVFDLYHERLKDKKQEHFIVLMLDTKNNIILEETIFIGTLDATLVHPREIFKPAVRNSASKIILVHNHPSGNPKPSNEDLKVFEKLIKSGEDLGINVLDSVIVGKNKFWSLKEKLNN